MERATISPRPSIWMPEIPRALAVETHENWIEDTRYINMNDLREHKKEVLRRLDPAA